MVLGVVFCCVWIVVRGQVGGEEWFGRRHVGRPRGMVSCFRGFVLRCFVDGFLLFNPTKERTEAARQTQTGRAGAASLLPGESGREIEAVSRKSRLLDSRVPTRGGGRCARVEKKPGSVLE